VPEGAAAGGAWARRGAAAGALLAYAAVSFAYFGRPIAAHPGRALVGRTTDPDIPVWSFGWWAHALRHGENPLYTHAIWAPDGLNLAWTATSQGLAAAFVPLTLAAGPIVAYNVAVVLMPALAAWTMFLLCRYLTGAFWPALLGGYLFGFSSYVLAHTQAHVHVTAVFLVPLVALVVLRYLDGRIGRRALALELGALLGAQLWISTEVATTVTLALAVGLALAFGLDPSRRPRVRSSLAPIAGGYAFAALLAAPLLWYALSDFRSGTLNPPRLYVADLANTVVPTTLIQLGGSWAAGISAHFRGDIFEDDAYLGLPALAILALYGLGRRRAPGGRFLLAAFAIAAVAALGDRLHVDGHALFPLPWRLVIDLPVFDNILPTRLSLFAVLAAATAAALWAASRDVPAWLRVGLSALAVASLVPALGLSSWRHDVSFPSFFSERDYLACIRAGDNVLAVPYGYTGDSLLWQSVSDFRFRMPGGQVAPAPPAAFFTTTVLRLINDDVRMPDGQTVVDFARSKGVSTILVDPRDNYPWATVLAPAGRPERIGGLLVYPLEPGAATSPACTLTQSSPLPTA
jgi:hypothetical protein